MAGDPTAFDVLLSWFRDFGEALNKRLDRLESKIDQDMVALERRLDGLDGRVTDLEGRADADESAAKAVTQTKDEFAQRNAQLKTWRLAAISTVAMVIATGLGAVIGNLVH